MPFLNCPSCGLVIPVERPGEMIEHCPRCLAQRRRAVELFVSARPRGAVRADGRSRRAASDATAGEDE